MPKALPAFKTRCAVTVLALATAAASLSACRNSGVAGGNPPDAGEGGGDGTGSAWILGDWSGNYQNKDESAGASLRETTAVAKFTKAGETSGTFAFEFPMMEGVAVKGTFRDFARKSLMLTIKESNLSAIGLSGATTSMEYDLVGDALELRNDRVLLQLIRGKPDQPAGGGDGDGEEPASNTVLGLWRCYDRQNHTWRINLRTADAFTIDVFDSGSTAAALRFDGAVTVDDPDAGSHKASLEVTWASDGDYVGNRYAAVQTGSTLVFSRLESDGATVIEAMSCMRE